MIYPPATTLTLILESGVLLAQGIHPILPAHELVARERTKPLGTRAATQHLLGQKERLGLGSMDEFKIRSSSQNTQGQIIVRFDQTHQGYRVWGASAIARVNPDGGAETTAASLEKSIALPSGPRRSQEEALKIAHADIAPKGAYIAWPTAERIVFPTRFTGGVKYFHDPKSTRQELDRANSVLAPKPTADHVWAYEIISVLHNREDGVREMHHIVDADTGAILRKWDNIKNVAPNRTVPYGRTSLYSSGPVAPPRVVPLALAAGSPRLLAPAAPAPAVGIGNSQYSGVVSLSTTLNDSGGYDLIDLTRGSSPSQLAQPTFTWNTTFFADQTEDGNWAKYSGINADADNVWGDGHDYLDPIDPGHPTDANGQTAAVDAHFGMTTTYDFYKNIMNRRSVDDLDTALGCVVHESTHDANQNLVRYDNAFWSADVGMMFYGDGSYPGNPSGFTALTAMDITGHELTHGVAQYTANFDQDGEPGGLNEGDSDIFGNMIQAYAKRPAGTDASVPSTGNDWLVGSAITHGGPPLRYMYKPSKDEMSPDAWYWGIGHYDVHFSNGPLNRFFYFLSQGASNEKSSDYYSPYLPGGMTGIGNDRAARIWYKALSEHLTHNSGYLDTLDGSGAVVALGARSAALLAATDLYGAGSNEAAAVENAFAAVNVGSAHGQPPRTLVIPYIVNTVGEIGANSPYIQYVPGSVKVPLTVDVQNNTNRAVTWQLGGFDYSGTRYAGGVLEPDGKTWLTPNRMGFEDLRAFSVADPLQFAEIQYYLVNLDSDDDVEVDAIDMGAIAMSWWLDQSITPSVSVYGNSKVDDLDVYIFGAAFKVAFEQ